MRRLGQSEFTDPTTTLDVRLLSLQFKETLNVYKRTTSATLNPPYTDLWKHRVWAQMGKAASSCMEEKGQTKSIGLGFAISSNYAWQSVGDTSRYKEIHFR